MEDAIIFDNGTGSIKSGYIGENVPRANYKNLVGRPKVKEVGMCDTYVAEFVKPERDNVTSPIVRGVISNFEDIETVWYHGYYNELREDPGEHPIILTESLWNTMNAREQTAKVMFETYSVPSILFVEQTRCTLTGGGSKTGVVVECGHGVTQVVPIVNGKHVLAGSSKIDFGGLDLENEGDKLNAFFAKTNLLNAIEKAVGHAGDVIYLGGGVSAIAGLVDKIKSARPACKITHVKADRPHYSVYDGASQIIEAYPELEGDFVSADDFGEVGAAALNKFHHL